MKLLVRAVTNYIRQTDHWLWFFCLGLTAFSASLLSGIHLYGHPINASDVGLRTIAVQLGAAGIGSIAAIIISKFDHHTLGKLWKLHVPAAYGLVLLTFIIGVGTQARPEDRSWLMIAGVSLQPTELLKISFILTFAYHLFKVGEELNRPLQMLLVCLHGAAPILLVHFQGDDGTALIIALIFVFMLFAAGVSRKYILSAFAALLAAAPLAWRYVLNSDQKNRILALFNPNTDLLGDLYQQYNAKLAIGSGQVWGKGIFQPKHQYVPEVHNDFILAFIGESLGFVGCLAVIAVITALCCKLLSNTSRIEDALGKYIFVGVFAMIASQTIINIGMCLMLLPVIGITLPFLSAGGSSVLATYMAMGLALSVYMHSNTNLFSDG